MTSIHKSESILETFYDAIRYAGKIHCEGWPEDDGDLNWVEGVRQSIRLATGGVLMFLESNPDFPTLVKCESIIRQFQLPACDAVYHFARLHGDHTYRLTGNRGSARVFQITTWKGTCSNQDNNSYTLVSEQDSVGDPRLADGKDLDVILSRTPQEGHWIELPEGPCEVWVRQYYGDWDTETPATLMNIQREGVVYPPPPITLAKLEEQMKLANDWTRWQSGHFLDKVSEHLRIDPGRLPIVSHPTAWQSNKYLSGHYRCQPDEAVIIEAQAPMSHYWGLQITNLQWEAMEYYMRSTSINHAGAHIDDDGYYRVVISHEDPGVPNWFDTSGRTIGLISGRYFKAGDVEEPTLRTVPLKDVRKYLPANTPVISREERQEAIRNRLASVFRRLAADQ